MTAPPNSLSRYAWLSIGAAVVTITLKTIAFLLTNSVGLLSDALESIVNLVGAMMALAMLAVASRPPDEGHTFGHTKAEYFSSGLEGVLILIAGIAVGIPAVYRLIFPVPLHRLDVGILVAVLASCINLATAVILRRVGRRYGSIALEANAHHLLTDVWTSLAVIIGVAGVWITGWTRLDPIAALLVAANILRTAWQILGRTVSGLMDKAISLEDQSKIREIFSRYESQGIRFHLLQTRQAGQSKFISFHVLVPGEWTVKQGHDLLEELETQVHQSVPGSIVFTHLEPLDDPTAWDVGCWEQGPTRRKDSQEKNSQA